MHSYTHITQVTQTDWLIYHTFHECSAAAQTFLKLLFQFILRLLSFPWREGRMLVLSSKYKLEHLVLQIGYHFNHLASLRKSALIQKPLAKIPKDLNQHGVAEKTKKY